MQSDEFAFEAPPGWTPAPGAERLTFIDDRGGVLIVSSSRVVPAESEGDLEMSLSDAISSASAAARRAAADRDMVQISDLHESRHHNLRCWTGEARARDGSVTISQCVLASRRGVFLATLETPPPEQSHREVFQAFVESVFSSDFRALIHRVRRTPPTCIANAAPSPDAEPDPPGPDRPDGEQFGTTFCLGCPCGSRQTMILGFPNKPDSEILMLAPLALQCCACNRVTEVFDPDLHGCDAEVTGEGRGMRGSGERQLHRCSACGQSVGEAVATFSFNDPEGLQTLPDALGDREQDTFDWFALEWQCAACGKSDCVTDYELA